MKYITMFPAEVWFRVWGHCRFAEWCQLTKADPGTFGEWADKSFSRSRRWGVTLCEALREDLLAVTLRVALCIHAPEDVKALIDLIVELGAWKSAAKILPMLRISSGEFVTHAVHKFAKKGRYGLVAAIGMKYPGRSVLADIVAALSDGGKRNLGKVDHPDEFTDRIYQYGQNHGHRGIGADIICLLPAAWVERAAMGFEQYLRATTIKRKSGRKKTGDRQRRTIMMSLCLAEKVKTYEPGLVL